jgi:very-short-patch-repair endonuclease
MAAVLACGPGAVLSHTSAAALWQLLPPRGFVHVTVPGAGRTRDRIRVHRSKMLSDEDATRRAGIPVTTPARTLTDLRRIIPQPQFAAALRKAEFLRLPLDDRLDPDHTRSELEARFLALCRRHRLPRPAVNERVGRYVVDFVWLDRRLVIELDGYQAHGSRSAFEADRTRDAELKLLGFEVVRLTWRRLRAEPAAVASMLRALLRRADLSVARGRPVRSQ